MSFLPTAGWAGVKFLESPLPLVEGVLTPTSEQQQGGCPHPGTHYLLQMENLGINRIKLRVVLFKVPPP